MHSKDFKKLWAAQLPIHFFLPKETLPNTNKKRIAAFRNEFYRPSEGIFLISRPLLERILKVRQFTEDPFSKKNPLKRWYEVLHESELKPILEKEAPKLLDELQISALKQQNIILLAMPPQKIFQEKNFLPILHSYWGLLFQALLYKRGKELIDHGQISRLQIREFFQHCGTEFYEEIKHIFQSEHKNVRNEWELFLEFLTYYLHSYFFSPLFLKTFFPSFSQFRQVAQKLEEFGFNSLELLEKSRPQNWTPPLSVFLGYHQSQIGELEGETAPQAEEQYFLQLLQYPAVQEQFSENSPSYEKIFQPFLKQSLQSFFYQHQPVNKLSFLALINLSVCFPKHIDGPMLFLCDQLYKVHFPQLYQPATFFQRLQIYLLGPGFVERLKQHEKREKSTRFSLQKLQHQKEVIEAKAPVPFFQSLKKWVLRITGFTLFHTLFSFFLRQWEILGSALLHFTTPIFQKTVDHTRIRRFAKEYRLFYEAKENNCLISALLALSRSIRVFEELGGRYLLPEAESLRLLFEQEFRTQVEWVVAQLLEELQLPQEDQSNFVQMLRYLLYASHNQEDPIARYILMDLERSSQEAKRQFFGLNFRQWFFSWGKQPLRRTFLFYPKLRRVYRLNLALSKLRRLKLSPQEYSRYEQILEKVVYRFEKQLQEEIKSNLVLIFEQVQLAPKKYSEKVAFFQVQEEIAQHIVARHQLNFMDLRDILSRNDLKFSDWQTFRDLRLQDVFSQLDAKLYEHFKDVYTRGEIYLKGLHLLSGLFFGTPTGRFFVRYFFFPFGVSLCFLVILQYFVFPSVQAWKNEVILTSHTLFSFAFLVGILFLTQWGQKFLHFLGAFFKNGFWFFSLGFKFLFSSLPLFVVRKIDHWIPYRLRTNILSPITFSLMCSLFFYWYLIPEELIHTIWHPIAFFSLLSVLLFLINPLWQDVKRKVRLFTLEISHIWLKNMFLSFLKWILKGCHLFLWLVEKTIYGIQQHLRFQKGEWFLTTIFKSVLSFIFFWPTYLTRFYTRIFLEPQVNPLKFPAVSLTYKVWFPIALTFVKQHEKTLDALVFPELILLNHGIAYWFVQFHAFIFTGCFGFLVWELKQNWGLYQANRPKIISKSAVLENGDTLPELLYTGPSPGKIPALYQKLRNTLKLDHETDLLRIRTIETQLQEMRRHLYHFAKKHLLYGLKSHAVFEGVPFKIKTIRLFVGGLFVSIKIGTEENAYLMLHFEIKNERLYVFSKLSEGANNRLSALQKEYLDLVLFAFYKKAGVSWIEEQILHFLEKRYASFFQSSSQKILFALQKNRIRLNLPIEGYLGWKEVYYKCSTRKVRAKSDDLVSEPFDGKKIMFWKQPLYWECFHQLMETETPDFSSFFQTYSPLLSAPLPHNIQSTLSL